jgi:hypothetical protein
MVLAALAIATPAGASTPHDLRGTWDCCGSGGAGAQRFVIEAMDMSSGQFSGHAERPDGSTFSPISGTANGDSVSLTTGPYTGGSYSATFTGAIAADSLSMSGSWQSNNNQNGTWTATRPSAPAPNPNPNPNPNPPPQPGQARTGLSLLCSYDLLTTRHTCHATVVGGSSAATGRVSFSSSNTRTGGTFVAGSSCALAVSGDRAACSVLFQAGFEGTVLTAAYAGDATHAAASAQAAICQARTGFAFCSDPTAQAAACKPGAPVQPQCQKPGVLDEKCTTNRNATVACQPLAPSIQACGGMGTQLRECDKPPQQVLGVCGPATIFGPCANTNQPVLVCAPTGAIPACNFSTAIQAAPLDLNQPGGGSVTVDVGCPKKTAKAQAKSACPAQPTVTLVEWASAQTEVLLGVAADYARRDIVPRAARCPFYESYETCQGKEIPEEQAPITRAQAKLTATFNGQQFVSRVRVHAVTLVTGNGSTAATPNGEKFWPRDALGFSYRGPESLIHNRVMADVASGMGAQFGSAFAVAQSLRRKSQPRRLAIAAATRRPRVVRRRVLMRAGRRNRVRIPITAGVLRALSGGTLRTGIVPLRLTLSYRARPYPVVRVMDIRVRVVPKRRR